MKQTFSRFHSLLLLLTLVFPPWCLAGAAPEVYVTKISTSLVFTALLLTDVSSFVTGGSTTLRLYELQADGTLKTYDFSSNTFKTTGINAPNDMAPMTVRKGNNGTVDTGLWTALITPITGFTVNNVYLMEVNNINSRPQTVSQMFQYGTVTSPAGGFFLVSGRVTLSGNAHASMQ